MLFRKKSSRLNSIFKFIFKIDLFIFLIGCDLLGRYLQTVDRDYEKANKVFKENCDARKFGQSCTSYAQNQLNGRGNYIN